MAQNLSSEDILLEKNLGLFCYSAQLVSSDLLAFVENNICANFFTPKNFEINAEEKDVSRRYAIRDGKDGSGMVLDASEFGVKDIYGAVKLFEEITGL